MKNSTTYPKKLKIVEILIVSYYNAGKGSFGKYLPLLIILPVHTEQIKIFVMVVSLKHTRYRRFS